MAKKVRETTWMATVRYPDGVNHVSTLNAPETDEALPEQLDQWMSAILKEHGTHNARCYISKVVYYISY